MWCWTWPCLHPSPQSPQDKILCWAFKVLHNLARPIAPASSSTISSHADPFTVPLKLRSFLTVTLHTHCLLCLEYFCCPSLQVQDPYFSAVTYFRHHLFGDNLRQNPKAQHSYIYHRNHCIVLQFIFLQMAPSI